jgi:hypothetical protein
VFCVLFEYTALDGAFFSHLSAPGFGFFLIIKWLALLIIPEHRGFLMAKTNKLKQINALAFMDGH